MVFRLSTTVSLMLPVKHPIIDLFVNKKCHECETIGAETRQNSYHRFHRRERTWVVETTRSNGLQNWTAGKGTAQSMVEWATTRASGINYRSGNAAA
jgi:hypothetical protein